MLSDVKLNELCAGGLETGDIERRVLDRRIFLGETLGEPTSVGIQVSDISIGNGGGGGGKSSRTMSDRTKLEGTSFTLGLKGDGWCTWSIIRGLKGEGWC